jgi:DNA-binding IclR family transcriptional regulator
MQWTWASTRQTAPSRRRCQAQTGRRPGRRRPGRRAAPPRPARKLLLATYDEQRLARFLRDPLPALTPRTITSKRALRRELDEVRAQGYAATVDELEAALRRNRPAAA